VGLLGVVFYEYMQNQRLVKMRESIAYENKKLRMIKELEI
jgi:hypothetical protein